MYAITRKTLFLACLAATALSATACKDRETDIAVKAPGEAAQPAEPAPMPTTPTPPPADTSGTTMTTPGDTTTMSGATLTDGTSAGAASHPDATFFELAASAGLTEVEAGKLAMEKSTDAGINKFGSSMVKDHGAANSELKTLAGNEGVTLPAAPLEAHQETLDELRTKAGAEFDEAYASAQVKQHEDAVALFDRTATSASDAEVRAFAARKLPALRHHLEMAKQLEEQTKAKSVSSR